MIKIILLNFILLSAVSSFALPAENMTLMERRAQVSVPELSRVQREALLLNTKTMLTGMLFADINQKLPYLEEKLQEVESKVAEASSEDFIRSLLNIYNENKDFHTDLLMPKSYSKYTSYLPVQISRIYKKGRPYKYVITNIVEELAPSGLQIGDEVLSYNHQAMHEFIADESSADQANPEASQRAKLKLSYFVRHAKKLFPEDDRVVLTVRSMKSGVQDINLDWYSTTSTNISEIYQQKVKSTTQNLAGLSSAGNSVFYKMLEKNGKKWGYILLTGFPDGVDTAVVNLINGSLAQADGYVIDVRDNSGGSIVASEKLAKAFVGEAMLPLMYSLRVTPVNSFLFQNITGSLFSPETRSTYLAAQGAGQKFTEAIPRTKLTDLEQVAKVTDKKIKILTNALCFSSCENFVALMKDYDRALVYGEGDWATAGGGAQVWKLSEFLSELPKEKLDGQLFLGLPAGYDLRVAFRGNFRSINQESVAIEDVGVEVDYLAERNWNDFLDADSSLISKILN